jgi:hypothetical protein
MPAVRQSCTSTNEQKTILFLKLDVDADVEFTLRQQEQPNDPFTIKNAFSVLASFRPLAPVSLLTVTCACLVELYSIL